jgi:hypothetical protein
MKKRLHVEAPASKSAAKNDSPARGISVCDGRQRCMKLTSDDSLQNRADGRFSAAEIAGRFTETKLEDFSPIPPGSSH